MDSNNAISVFEGKNIRKTWHNNEWWFVIEDIIFVLIDSKDPKGYLKDMRRRDEELSKGWGQIATTLPIDTSGGKQNMNCTNTKGAFRIVQSITSPKAEPFKLWLAQVGYERVKEIADPELAQQRMKELYRLKGYSDDWIEKRVRGIAVRQELTDEWKKHDVKEDVEFAILTNEISKATFGKTVEEYKSFKNLNKENLRDHMNDLELIFTMLGERVTTEITKNENAEGFDDCKDKAIRGGKVAGNARKEAEKEIGKTITSNENYLDQSESVKRKRISKD
ncbi:MAG: Bro-N domain-containing protein [Nanoarchaeota archaeon]